MPDDLTHSRLTENALSLASGATEPNRQLIEEYCHYPDYYFSKTEEVMPYSFFTDGIQFHYLPDTPYNELYRYWDVGAQGIHRSKKFENTNFFCARAGFTYYLSRIQACLNAGEAQEGRKFLGCLLHMLQDATFGFHALEGAGGTDALILNRLFEAVPSPAEVLARGGCPDYRLNAYAPQSLGTTTAEKVMRLYAAYCRTAADSRQCCLRLVMAEYADRRDEVENSWKRMYENAVKLCADVVHSVFAPQRDVHMSGSCALSELEPFEFPMGGFGGYRFRTVERNAAWIDAANARNLSLLERTGALRDYRTGLSFGTHFEGALLYDLAPDIFCRFTCDIGLHPSIGPGTGSCRINIFNDGKIVEQLILTPSQSLQALEIAAPRGEFGFRFHSTPSCGVVVLGAPVLSRV